VGGICEADRMSARAEVLHCVASVNIRICICKCCCCQQQWRMSVVAVFNDGQIKLQYQRAVYADK